MISVFFGADVLEQCCKRLNIDMIVRGHQVYFLITYKGIKEIILVIKFFLNILMKNCK